MPWTRFVCLCAWLLAAGITRGAEPEPPKLPIDAYRLPNGLKVVLSRDPTVPRVTVCVAYHVGSKNERSGRTGFAHFFEHMMFRGTKHVPNYDIPLQEAGAQSNAFTSEDLTVYFETVPSNFLERALYLEAERQAFLASALDQEKFDTEREVVKNERRQSYENVPYGLAEESLLAHVFPPGHPYSWSVIGSMKDLNNASLNDLKRFFQQFYHPGNAALCLVGDFDPEQAKAWIKEYFGPLAAGPAASKIEPPRAPKVAERLTQTDRVQRPRIYWAWPTVADEHPDAPALDLLSSVLAGGDASRLHRVLVLDQRIAQDVSASSDTKEISGLFIIDATAAPGHTVAEMEKVLGAELEKIRSAPPSERELQRALAKVEKGTYSALTPPLGRAIALDSGFLEHDDPAYYRRDFERYFRVTPADVERVAKTYLGPDKVVLDIEPAGSSEPKHETIQAGPKPDGTAEPALVDRSPAAGPDWSKIPGPSAPRPFHPPAITRKKLSNGLDVWIAEWHTLPIVATRILIPAGTGDDPHDKSGVATLTATLLDQGTKDLTATELTEQFELHGTSPSVGVTVDETRVGFSLVKRHLPEVMELTGRMLSAPRFDPADVDRERQLQLAELEQGPDRPAWLAQRAFRALLYGQSHPYGNPTDGFIDTVKNLTRNDVLAFHKAHFATDHSTLIVVGDVKPEPLLATLEKTLKAWSTTGPGPGPRPARESPAEPGNVYLVDKPGAVQSVVDVGRLWVDRKDARYFATLIGNRIVGGDFLSRLNKNLREEHGYTYGAHSLFLYRRHGSVWAVNSDVRSDATAPALREIQKELDGLASAKTPFAEKEIEVARSAEARTFPQSFESPAGIAGELEDMALFDLPADYLDTFLDHLNATRAEEIQQAMAEVVDPAKRVIVVVGDRKQVESQLEKTGFSRIRAVTADGKPVAR